MEFFDSNKSIIENIYLLSGPLLVFLGIIGLFQLKLTKKTLIITSKRSAAILAAKQTDIYNNKIIPLQDELYLLNEAAKIKDVKIDIGEFNIEYIYSILGKEQTIKLITEREKNVILFLRIVNSMESFSVYFTKGVADEDIAFSSVGRTFCFSVESLYFDIATSISKGDSPFQNMISLYGAWSRRLNKERLTKQKDELINQIGSLNDKKISPIGVK